MAYRNIEERCLFCVKFDAVTRLDLLHYPKIKNLFIDGQANVLDSSLPVASIVEFFFIPSLTLWLLLWSRLSC